MHSLSLLAFASTALGAIQGFNYGSTFTDNSAKQQSDFQAEFAAAKALANTNGAFSSARLYTTIQAGTANSPISAIPAAIAEGTTLLLGLWASGGQSGISNEIMALQAAMSANSDLAKYVTGISVGSEDLYRISPTGVEAGSGVGAGPDTIVNYIQQVRTAIKGSILSDIPVGHVDTWTAWVNGSNNAVIEACDFIGMDAYPYFQNTMSNSISSASELFFAAYDQTVSAAGAKPVWVTETGWPVSGKSENLGVPSVANAKTYWDEVGCKLFGKTNTYWYTVLDAAPTTPNPSFGIIPALGSQPLYDLSCANVDTSSPTSGSSSTSTASSGKGAGSSTSTAVSSGNGSSQSTMMSSVSPETTMTTMVSGSPTVVVVSPSASASTSSSEESGSPTVSAASTTASISTQTGAAMIKSASFLGAIGAAMAIVVAV